MSVRRFAFHYEPLAVHTSSSAVFCDPTQVRKSRLRRRFIIVIATLGLWLLFFISGGQPISSDYGQLPDISSAALSQQPFPPNAAFANTQDETQSAIAAKCGVVQSASSAIGDEVFRPQIFAHLPVAQQWAHLSLEKSCETIDVLVPDWITLKEAADGLSVELASRDTRMPVEEFLLGAKSPPDIMPRIQVEFRPIQTNIWEKIADTKTRQALVANLKLSLAAVGASGVCLDLGQFPDSVEGQVRELLDDVKTSLKNEGLSSCLIISGTNPAWMDNQKTDGFDHVVVKLFYEPWVGSAPKPLSQNSWFLDNAQRSVDLIGQDRLVIAIGIFGSSWESGIPLPNRLSYGEVLSEVTKAGVPLVFNEKASGSHAAYRNEEGRRQKLWLQDVASAFNQLSLLEQAGVASVGIWSLGQEDPSLWPLLKRELAADSLSDPALRGTTIDTYVEYTGTGPALRVQERAQFGLRTFTLSDDTALVKDLTYSSYPQPFRLERYGEPSTGDVVLTFDDGPHPEFTPQILDILEETGTPAAFFVLGQNVVEHPEILQRIVEAGHEIGTHSFSHPRMDKISDARTYFEHGLTDRAVASAVNKTTLLYREPFLRSGGPISGTRIDPLITVQSRGQINFGMDVVPKDWLGLTSDEIAAYVIDQVEVGAGKVILLHDGGGGDRTASVDALPTIISELNARGYTFKPIGDVLGLNRATLMPPASGAQRVFDRVSFAFASGTINGLELLFWFVLFIGLSRSAVIASLAFLRRRHNAQHDGPQPKVSVVIPAYNEEAALGRCIESVLASKYTRLEVVVVDDGSSDATLDVILEYKFETKVRMISHPNQGKWSALNRAIMTLDTDIAVCIDADTQIAPDAVPYLVEHFQDPTVGAVAGKIAVGNLINPLTKMQALEYVVAQNFERRAFDCINGIMVVPGAIGAWRLTALQKAGLFCPDTMTEDCDLTISVNRAGYRVVYEESAVAFTEVPQSVGALMTQRLRWSLGMFQSAWKHKKSILEGRSIGLVSIPDMLIFGYLFPLLAPIADLFLVLLVYQLFAGSWSGDVGAGIPMISPELLWAYVALPALEFLIATFAVFTDRTAKKSLILLWPFQRVFYRPLLYLTVFRALLRAFSGTLAAWGKSKRHGSQLLRLEGST